MLERDHTLRQAARYVTPVWRGQRASGRNAAPSRLLPPQSTDPLPTSLLHPLHGATPTALKSEADCLKPDSAETLWIPHTSSWSNIHTERQHHYRQLGERALRAGQRKRWEMSKRRSRCDDGGEGCHDTAGAVRAASGAVPAARQGGGEGGRHPAAQQADGVQGARDAAARAGRAAEPGRQC